jgi:hypothetical protein
MKNKNFEIVKNLIPRAISMAIFNRHLKDKLVAFYLVVKTLLSSPCGINSITKLNGAFTMPKSLTKFLWCTLLYYDY